MKIRAIEDGDVEDVVALWDACGLTRPWNGPTTILHSHKSDNSVLDIRPYE